MSDLIPFYCPTHGYLLDTFPHARVECGQCHEEGTPADVPLQDHRDRYADRRHHRGRRVPWIG